MIQSDMTKHMAATCGHRKRRAQHGDVAGAQREFHGLEHSTMEASSARWPWPTKYWPPIASGRTGRRGEAGALEMRRSVGGTAVRSASVNRQA